MAALGQKLITFITFSTCGSQKQCYVFKCPKITLCFYTEHLAYSKDFVGVSHSV